MIKKKRKRENKLYKEKKNLRNKLIQIANNKC